MGIRCEQTHHARNKNLIFYVDRTASAASLSPDGNRAAESLVSGRRHADAAALTSAVYVHAAILGERALGEIAPITHGLSPILHLFTFTLLDADSFSRP